MGRTNRTPRTPRQAAADRAAEELARKLARMLRDGRVRQRRLQRQVAADAGLSRTRLTDFENGRGRDGTITSWSRAAAAVGGALDAWIKETSAATLPRDAVHLKGQNLILGQGRSGGWQGLPEEMIDREARTSRAADVLLTRKRPRAPTEYAIWDVRDWIDDVGAAVRDFSRRVAALDRYAVARMSQGDELPRTGGCFVLRATARNRALVREHRDFFRARFPGSARAWLASLTNADAPLPDEPALVWVAVNGERLFESRR